MVGSYTTIKYNVILDMSSVLVNKIYLSYMPSSLPQRLHPGGLLGAGPRRPVHVGLLPRWADMWAAGTRQVRFGPQRLRLGGWLQRLLPRWVESRIKLFIMWYLLGRKLKLMLCYYANTSIEIIYVHVLFMCVVATILLDISQKIIQIGPSKRANVIDHWCFF